MISFEKEKEKLKKVKTLSEFFEVKREVLHKIVDYIRNLYPESSDTQYLCDTLDEYIDICYKDIPDDIRAENHIDEAVHNLCDELTLLEETINEDGIESVELIDIPIFSQTCPFCIEYFSLCESCPYQEKHGYCGDDETDWDVMRGLFDELLS